MPSVWVSYINTLHMTPKPLSTVYTEGKRATNINPAGPHQRQGLPTLETQSLRVLPVPTLFHLKAPHPKRTLGASSGNQVSFSILHSLSPMGGVGGTVNKVKKKKGGHRSQDFSAG